MCTKLKGRLRNQLQPGAWAYDVFFWPLVFTFLPLFSTFSHTWHTPLFFCHNPFFFRHWVFFLLAFFTLKPHNPLDSIRVVLSCFRVEIGAGKKIGKKKRGMLLKSGKQWLKSEKKSAEKITIHHELQKVCPTLPYWQSVKNSQIGCKFSQILMNEPQIWGPKNWLSTPTQHHFMVASEKKWRQTPPGWLAETSQMISQQSET